MPNFCRDFRLGHFGADPHEASGTCGTSGIFFLQVGVEISDSPYVSSTSFSPSVSTSILIFITHILHRLSNAFIHPRKCHKNARKISVASVLPTREYPQFCPRESAAVQTYHLTSEVPHLIPHLTSEVPHLIPHLN